MPDRGPEGRQVLGAAEIASAIEAMARAILAAAPSPGSLCFIGIRQGGVPIAARLAAAIERGVGVRVPRGVLDIGLYRDDVPRVRPVVGPTEILFSLQDRTVVLVDDVLFTGRTVRAALDEIMDFGRPRRVYLAVLVDRGGRELPVAADFVGHRLSCGPDEIVEVRLAEVEGEDAVVVAARPSR